MEALHREALLSTGAYVQSGSWDSDINDIDTHYIQNGGDFLVGYADEALIAMGGFRSLRDGVAEIKRMRVAPSCQRRGVGKRLLSILEQSATLMGYESIELDTTVRQLAAIRLYEGTGYIETRRTTEGFPYETIFYRKNLI